MKIIALVLLLLSISLSLEAAVGCMQVAYCAGASYSPVSCSCPCWRYEHLYDRGMCVKCQHFRRPTEISYNYTLRNERIRKLAFISKQKRNNAIRIK